ncbi:MAG: Zn-dependent hydrolase [Chloroflexi bacterium]|nr:MAG: Zn-dependent hydrolase [Chloroflexota bacterium]
MIRTPAVDSARMQADLDALAEFREPDAEGWTRRVFSPAYTRSREWVASSMGDAGLAVKRDGAGNVVGALPGSSSGLLVTGSHTDTVAGGGRFDGPLGVLAAIEVARCIRDSGYALQHELRVVDFLGEEPNEFGVSCVGSRSIAGTLTPTHLASRDASGRTLAEAIASAGGDPDRISDAAWTPGSMSAFVELHIEQGPVLEDSGIPLAIVSGIAGIDRVQAIFSGEAAHAGTTPMDSRHDALCAAAEAVLAVERLASGGVGTTGRLEVFPGAANVVPGKAEMWAEFRSIDRAWLDERHEGFARAAAEAGARRGVVTKVSAMSRTEPVTTSAEVRAAMKIAIEGLGLQFLVLASGAGHDTVQMARLGPVGMIFVPSAGGRSHCADEWTGPEYVEAGASALLATILALDAR